MEEDKIPASDEQQEELELRMTEYAQAGGMTADFHPEMQEALVAAFGNIILMMNAGEVSLASAGAGTVIRIAFALGREYERETLKTRRGEHTGG